MTNFQLPYGSEKIEIILPDDVNAEEINPVAPKTVVNPEKSILKALNNPVTGPKFDELFDPSIPQTICLVIDDYTRTSPIKLLIPPILKHLDELGINHENIFFLMACGTHTPPTEQQITNMFGEPGSSIIEGYELRFNDIKQSTFRDLGTTSFGTPIQINEDYLNADIKILLTDIEYHYYAGFGGDRKSILPGISSEKSIEHNHGLLVDPLAITGNLEGNPIHLDMNEIARAAPPDFVVNVVMSLDDKLIDVKCGPLDIAFKEAAQIYDKNYAIFIEELADVAIISAGGYPKDINLYQATKAIEHCRNAVKAGGTIIFIAECRDGIGHKVFEEWMEKYPTLESVSEAVCAHFKMGGHKVFYLLKALSNATIFIYSQIPQDIIETKYQLKYIENLQDLFQDTIQVGQKVYVVPHGGSLLLKPKYAPIDAMSKCES